MKLTEIIRPLLIAQGITGLTGGTSTDLDGIDTVDIDVGMFLLFRVATSVYPYELVAGTDAEASPTVIRPDDYDGTTNQKVWKLRGILTAGTSKIGHAAADPLGFWGANAASQPSGSAQAAVTIVNADNDIGGLTFSASPTQAECEALRDACEVLADDVRNLSALVHALRLAGVNSGLIKGSA